MDQYKVCIHYVREDYDGRRVEDCMLFYREALSPRGAEAKARKIFSQRARRMRKRNPGIRDITVSKVTATVEWIQMGLWEA